MMRDMNGLARKVRPVERMREEKAKRRHDTIHARHRNPGVVLFDLKATHIFRRRSLGGIPKERRKPRNIA